MNDRSKALRPLIQTTFDAGGLDAICEIFAKLVTPAEELQINIVKLQARVVELEKLLRKNGR
jgi:hypothetical protein